MNFRLFTALSLRFARSMALLSAAEHDDPAALMALADAGATLDAQHPCGSTALGAAARAGSERAIETLLALGARVDARGRDGDTPLIKAARNGHLGCAEILLRHRPDVGALCQERGWSALHWAGERKNIAMAMLLVGAGADPSAPSAPPDGQAPQTAGELARARGDALFGPLLESIEKPKPAKAGLGF